MAQTVLPAELCVVDSGDDTPVRDQMVELCRQVSLPLDYVNPAPGARCERTRALIPPPGIRSSSSTTTFTWLPIATPSA